MTTRAKYRRWTDFDYALLRRLWTQPGLKTSEIAACLGRRRGPVERVARERLGLLPRVTIRMKLARGERVA